MPNINHILRETLDFFTDDLVTAGIIIVWIALFAGIVRYAHVEEVVTAAVFVIGIVLCLTLSVWRRARQ